MFGFYEGFCTDVAVGVVDVDVVVCYDVDVVVVDDVDVVVVDDVDVIVVADNVTFLLLMMLFCCL